MEERLLQVTKKELFYTAFMLQLRQLVNIVYDFPADENKFEQELGEARSSLRKKKLLTESARQGISLDFGLCSCVAFCSEPESCEVVDVNGYCATIYAISGIYMLLEPLSQDKQDNFTVTWFINKNTLNEYINSKTQEEINN